MNSVSVSGGAEAAAAAERLLRLHERGAPRDEIQQAREAFIEATRRD